MKIPMTFPPKLSIGRSKNGLKNTEKTAEEECYYTQDLIGIKQIDNGFFKMTNGDYVGIVEILPINYEKKTSAVKETIISQYAALFKILPGFLHLKTVTQKVVIDDLALKVKEACLYEKDKRVLRQAEDYIEHIKSLQGKQTYVKKFYISFKYEGDVEGKRSTDREEILQAMMEVKWSIISQFKKMGHMVVMPQTKLEVSEQPLEALYNYFNPNSMRTEPYRARVLRIMHDQEQYNANAKKPRKIEVGDYIAPRGVKLHKKQKEVLMADGLYYTYLVLNDNSYPVGGDGVPVGWFNEIVNGIDGVNLDLIMRKKDRQTSGEILEKSLSITEARAGAAKSSTKRDRLSKKVMNGKYILSSMREKDEDLYNVVSIITVTAGSLKELRFKKNQVLREFKKRSMYVTQSYGLRMQLYRMTMPFAYVDEMLFWKFSHNFLSTALASFYWYSTFELFDPDGLVLGVNVENATLVAFNNFLGKYSNPHILIVGKSGAGKTFTEEMLGYRMRVNGIRCIYVIPSKGTLDYGAGCKNIGGKLIKLAPMSKHCINIMEIRAEANIKEQTESLLARKVQTVVAFIGQLLGKNHQMNVQQAAILNSEIMNLYRMFGINEDNESIWIDKSQGLKKDMPIIRDLYDVLKANPTLENIADVLKPFVSGNCKNMNGPTNVDLSNGYIVFDVDEEKIDKSLFSAFLFVAFDCAYSIAKQDAKEYTAVFLDEVWKMMDVPAAAEQVKAMVKLLRAYSSAVCIASQELDDFLQTTGGDGKAIIANTAIKLILALDTIEAEEISKILKLTEEDEQTIVSLDHAGLLIANNDKVNVALVASKHETRVFSEKGE